MVTRHSSAFDANATKRNLGLVDDSWQQSADAAEQMASKRLRDLDAKQVVIAIFGDPEAPADKQPNQHAMARSSTCSTAPLAAPACSPPPTALGAC